MSILQFRLVYLITGVLLSGTAVVFAQDDDDPIQPPFSNIYEDNFSANTMKSLIIKKINAFRIENKLDTLISGKVAQKAAADHAKFMAKMQTAATDVGGGKKKDTGGRVKFYGGSDKALELVAKSNISKGRDPYNYDKVADEIVQKWIGNKRDSETLLKRNLVFSGQGASLDEEGKRVYVSVVFGGYDMLNEGAAKVTELKYPYSKKKYGLKPYDDKQCRKCEKFNDLQELQKGLKVEGSSIYFEYDNFKALKRLIRKPKDGLAVEIIMKDQYPCGKEYNIYDNNLINKGVLLKRVYSKKLFKNNEIKERKANKIRVHLADLPKDFDHPDFELNLVVIQEKTYCASINRKYMKDLGIQSLTPLHLIPDTVFVATDGKYQLAADKTVLNFKIPFEKNKSDYKPEDIKTFLESLNEPDFIVKEIEIYAYSSIEGDSLKNDKLQNRRAESIVGALEKLQKGEVKRTIITSDSFKEFKKQVKGTPYEYLAKKTKEEVRNELNANKTLLRNMEPILQEQRYAQIIMTVEYDIKGKKEQPYLVSKFNKAVKAGDAKLATVLQNYIIEKVMYGRYTEEAITSPSIPRKKEFAHLIMNQIWFQNLAVKDTLDANECSTIDSLATLSPSDMNITFNQLVCVVKNSSISGEVEVNKMQTEIDNFYKSDIDKQDVDALNLEFRFKVIEAFDTIPDGESMVQASIDKIKEVFNLQESTWQNAMKLALIFVDQRQNYKYALDLLDPFVDREGVDQSLLETYISLCTYVKDRISTQKLRAAMLKLKEYDKETYCNLFKENRHSFQMFDNPVIKNDYCEACGF
ncbi:MAG: hypothetical protein KDD36_10175 [Flavobacteriales bacterium]|nr:hypothetical protein [Flavobacteriales bacterium]